MRKNTIGHLLAAMTVTMWGVTFISTKILLIDFTPTEILLYRFIIGFIALFVVYPRIFLFAGLKQELMLAGAGACGVTLYFIFENVALTYSTASNVGVIVSVAPILTAILAHRFLDGEKLTLSFFIGFLAAIAGISLVSFSGTQILKLNPAGDILAVLAAVTWAAYSILIKKITASGDSNIQVTRRIFLYGIVFTIPVLFFSDFSFGLERFMKPVNISNILFLGIGASALGFVTWNHAVKVLGAVKTSVYIYIVPVVTVVASVVILHERITWLSGCGIALTLLGLTVSEKKPHNAAKLDVGEREAASGGQRDNVPLESPLGVTGEDDSD